MYIVPVPIDPASWSLGASVGYWPEGDLDLSKNEPLGEGLVKHIPPLLVRAHRWREYFVFCAYDGSIDVSDVGHVLLKRSTDWNQCSGVSLLRCTVLMRSGKQPRHKLPVMSPLVLNSS
jgi:hypothetical protein